jgi:HPt (histidine-containing phosphotransfer) domain-containing protein
VNPLEEKMAELRRRFIARAGEEIAALDSALAANDTDGLIDRAHALAGISGMFGFDALGKAAAELEDAGLAGQPVAEQVGQLRALLARLSA